MSLHNLISSLNLTGGSRDKMYDNIKIISNYLDYPQSLSKIKKDDLLNIINSLGDKSTGKVFNNCKEDPNKTFIQLRKKNVGPIK
jgi:hypothetical protein